MGASTSVSFRELPPASSCCSVRSRRRREARPRDRARSRGQPHLPLLARVRAGGEAGAALRLSRAGAGRAGNAACDSTPAKVLLDPYGRGVVVPKNYTPEAARQPGDNAATAMKSVVVDPSRVRLGRRRAAAAAVRAHDHLRDARPRLHAPPEFRASARKRAAPTPA